jgi:hypothetical protein
VESGLNSDTVNVEILPDDISPVFVDSTGKRRRRFRMIGFIAGGVGVVYGVMLGLSFVGGPISPHALLPVPGVPTAAVIVTGPQPAGSMKPVSDGKVTRTSGAQPRTSAASTPKPGTSTTGKAVLVVGSGTPTPTPTAPSPDADPTPSPSQTTASPTPTPTKTTPAVDPTTTSPAADPPSSPPASPPASAPGGAGSAPTITPSASSSPAPTATVVAQASTTLES